MASVLIHACCAPCATYTVEHFRKERHELAGYWFNPNIHPLSEHALRLQTLIDFARDVGMPLEMTPDYKIEDYFQAVAGHEGQEARCRYCYLLRLGQAAGFAREKGFDAFTTTLLISPYQKHDVLKQTGEEIQAKVGIRFLYEDLRPGYHESRKMARELNFYRQRYCGCIFSHAERFSFPKK
ncbi:MAG: epoxyqueuosine reductase QueH [Chloroflexi bacterium]|nr:epoxyqueuosine reductase QueH [Chloroflexota bacterium]